MIFWGIKDGQVASVTIKAGQSIDEIMIGKSQPVSVTLTREELLTCINHPKYGFQVCDALQRNDLPKM